MASNNDLLVSTSDAQALARLVNDRTGYPLEINAADALADALSDARMVAHDRLPPDRVAIDSVVAYREEPHGIRRTVALVLPHNSNPSEGRVSVLSPVGRALLGRKAGSAAAVAVPGGKALKIRVLEIDRGGTA